jgi:ATP-dependent Clp protease protease subunit
MNPDEATRFHRLDDQIEGTLLASRRLTFFEGVDDESAKACIRKLWYLELMSPGEPILFVINSPGGSVDAGMAIWDQVRMIRSPVTTLITGLAASMGSILSLCAAKGRRLATPHSRIMIHQPAISGMVRGQATDLEIQAKEILKTREMLIKLYVEQTGKDYATIDRAIDRDTWMTSQEALEFGLLDRVVNDFQELDAVHTKKKKGANA